MKVRVIKEYKRLYENPIAVSRGDEVYPDFNRPTRIAGWVWCRSDDGRSGWAPDRWLVKQGEGWHLDRDFNAIELDVAPDEVLQIEAEESGFFWAVKGNGESGWVPCDPVSEPV